MKKIRNLIIQKDKNGNYKMIKIVFGPHYFLEINTEKEKINFLLGATHHGFKADASNIGGELEKFIYEIRDNHPENIID